jgi:8-oxo-dGTP pyrophosphatase MutT (NUDIX family)
MLTFHAAGDWRPDQVRVRWVPSARRIEPAVERAIDIAWESARARPGVNLFDGPMCRMESWRASADQLTFDISLTSYKPFFGTNLSHPEFAEQFGREVMANPVGVSPALHTCDNFLMMGRRNASVAYYPNRTHPFAGALEPGDEGDLFAAVRRELAEELSFVDADIAEIRCTGIAEDSSLRQMELLFRVQSTLTRKQVEAQVLAEEHRDSVAIPGTPDDVARAIGNLELTPVAVASLLLGGRVTFGQEWFTRAASSVASNELT